MKYTLQLLLVVGFYAFAFGQTPVVRGVVIEESKDGNFSPIAGANVYWLNTPQGTTTDTNGVFSIPAHPFSNFLVVSFTGYTSDTIAVFNPDRLRIILKTDDGKLQEVQISAERSSVFQEYLNPILTQNMTEKELFKAACCNLSESFETNPSVDVTFTDAVSGTKQIEMLGLSGAYTQITTENIPSMRGLMANFGLQFIPGSWIESIQVAKGVGSVANGFESVTGQINVELRKPETADKGFFNLYVGDMGRLEANLSLAEILPRSKWSTATLLHASSIVMENDVNRDKFMDIPTYRQFNLVHRWTYTNQKGLLAQFGAKALQDDKTGGTRSSVQGQNRYPISLKTMRTEVFGKIGYVFEGKKYKSIGLQTQLSYHDFQTSFSKTAYQAEQRSAYLNLIYQSIIMNTNHKFRAGSSLQYDYYNEQYILQPFVRTETVGGVFGEYTFSHLNKFSFVAGLRTDVHNLFGFFATPRLHLRYALTPNTVLRLSAGRGQRTANILVENTSVFASSRQIQILSDHSRKPYGLNPEVAWNYGASLSQDFTWHNREGNITVEYFRTDFVNQIVADYDHSPQKLLFYNLSGQSYSNSFQTEVNYELLRKLHLRLAYRYLDVRTTYSNTLLTKPLVAPHRGFATASYQTRNRWQFDYTVSWISAKRLPSTASNPAEFQMRSYSPAFFVHNTQVSKSLNKKADVYWGAENVFDFRQQNPIISAEQPYSPYFDASLVWAPIIGRMIYAGLRYRW